MKAERPVRSLLTISLARHDGRLDQAWPCQSHSTIVIGKNYGSADIFLLTTSLLLERRALSNFIYRPL